MKKNIAVLFLALMVTVLMGCGGDKKTPPTSGTPTSTGGDTTTTDDGGDTSGGDTDDGDGSETYPTDKGVATVTGTVKYDGKKPKVRDIATDADPKCAAMHKDSPLKTETAIVGEAGELKNVIVTVSKGLGAYGFEAPKESVLLDQVGCHYVPHVICVMADQTIQIRNSDDTLHNVHGIPGIAEEFNISQAKGKTSDKSFEDKDVIPVKCDVHPWMGSYIHVVENPFFAVTGADGKFAFTQKLIPGKYTLSAWHEKYKGGKTSIEIEVKEDGTFDAVDFVLSKK